MLGLIMIILGLVFLTIITLQKLVIPMGFMNYLLPICLDAEIVTPTEVENGNLAISFWLFQIKRNLP